MNMKSKLKIEKFEISKLSNLSSIYGGNGGDANDGNGETLRPTINGGVTITKK